MQFKTSPYVVFEKDDTPLTIHARLRWMNGGSKDRTRARQAVDALRHRQSDDGSWDGSVAQTIESLLGLWLLSDGVALYARACTRLHWLPRQHPFPTAHLVDHDLHLDLDTRISLFERSCCCSDGWILFGDEDGGSLVLDEARE